MIFSKKARVSFYVLACAVLSIFVFLVMPVHSQGVGEASSCNADTVCEMNGFKLGTSATPGYVLTADASGGGSWKSFASAVPCISGTGSSNYVSKWTGAKSLGNSIIYDNGNNVGIGTTNLATNEKLRIETPEGIWGIVSSRSGSLVGGIHSNGGILTLQAGSGGAYVAVANNGNVGIGTPSPSQKLDVSGQIHATGDICTDTGGTKCLSTSGFRITCDWNGWHADYNPSENCEGGCWDCYGSGDVFEFYCSGGVVTQVRLQNVCVDCRWICYE